MSNDGDSDGDALSCEEFDRAKFMSHFSLDNSGSGSEMLPVLSVLMGNDYVEASTFDRVFEQIRLPKKKYLSPRHKKMTGLLRWLSREKSVDTALERYDVVSQALFSTLDRKKLRF